LLKDNENVPLTNLDSDFSEVNEFQPFARELMVRCEECLRTNPPTRVNCLYCGAVLPMSESTINLQKPALRPLQKWEQGYNNILLSHPANLSESEVAEASDLLKMTQTDFRAIVGCHLPLPLARAGTPDEASLIKRRLSSLGLETQIIADAVLGDDGGPFKVRAVQIEERGLQAYQTPDLPPIEIAWSEPALFVIGRLIFQRVELREESGARSENRILDSSEFFRDVSVVDLYTQNQTRPFRIMAHSFDFSCLGEKKGLVAEENFATLLKLFGDRAPQAEWDDSYKLVRKALEPAWPSEQQNESGGWRRERPGKYSMGSINERSNEQQFTKYSRLRRHFLFSQQHKNDEAS
jgi:hypothetical protein